MQSRLGAGFVRVCGEVPISCWRLLDTLEPRNGNPAVLVHGHCCPSSAVVVRQPVTFPSSEKLTSSSVIFSCLISFGINMKTGYNSVQSFYKKILIFL